MAANNITEEWRTVADWADYEVSSLGRVRRRVPFYQANPKGKGLVERRSAGSILKPFPDADGYLVVNLVHEGNVKRRRVSVLVCRAFNGEPPTPKHQAAHEDGKKDRNVPSNLAWKTSKENNQDKVRHGTVIQGQRHRSAVLSEAQVIEIRATPIRSGRSARQMAMEFSVTKGAIDKARQGKTWKHL